MKINSLKKFIRPFLFYTIGVMPVVLGKYVSLWFLLLFLPVLYGIYLIDDKLFPEPFAPPMPKLPWAEDKND